MTLQTYTTKSQANMQNYHAESTPSIHVILIEPLIPHNTGAIGRLCVGLDARLHLIEPLGFSLDEKAIRRSGLDYWQNLALRVYPDWQQFLTDNHPQHIHFLSTRGKTSLFDIPFQPPCWLAFGNEARGLPPEFYRRYEDDLYKIPQPGEFARSLNLANAAAVTMYEAYRQIAAGSSS